MKKIENPANLDNKLVMEAALVDLGNTAENEVQMQKSKFKQKYRKHPYIIHACIFIRGKSFPTHTHGLNEQGWPEFMIDPACFSLKVNGIIINAAYDYFKKPRRKKLLNNILKGETFEIPGNKLCEGINWNGQNYPICFRLVPNTFEAVKLAYDTNGTGVDPDLVVVQIYVKGDDFALTDDYYKDGISW